MKNKKIIYAIIGIAILISMVVIIAIISNKPMPIDHTPKESTSILEELKKKYPDKKYLKLTGGEILNENTCFNKYSFINNNSIYIFNPEKLDIGEFTYKKVYDVDKNIKVMNITPDAGPDIKFYDYNDRDFSRSSYLLLSNTFRAVITFSTVIVINWQRTSKNSFIFTIIALLILLIGCFPMHLSRNAFGAIYICVLVTLVPWIKKNNRFIVLFTVCFLFMFPVMDLYRHKSFTEVGLREIFNSLITYKDYFNTANYDAYQMIIAAENATDIVGYTYGRQLLGVLLFFIPRNMWVNKPVGTGAYISNILNLEFSNISAPLIAEGYINFGIIGIIGFGLFTGMILRMLDNTYWNNNNENLSFINLIYFYVVPYMLFICRGDLLSSWAYLCAYLFVAYCLYKFALLTGKHQ